LKQSDASAPVGVPCNKKAIGVIKFYKWKPSALGWGPRISSGCVNRRASTSKSSELEEDWTLVERLNKLGVVEVLLSDARHPAGLKP
jgi:hypothetical protein